jgi:tryptophan 2,3-dioxygenase
MSAEESGNGMITWPEHVGVGGLSLHARTAPLHDRLGSTAAEAVDAWVEATRRGNGAATPASFPFGSVLAHYRAVGRAAASATLVGELRRIATSIPDDAEPDRRQLKTWLCSVTDQLDGDYHSYAGTTQLNEFLDRAPFGGGQGDVDTLFQGLLLDQLRTEAAVLAVAPSPAQRRRTNAVLHAVGQLDQLAPEALPAVPDVAEVLEGARTGASDGELAESAAKVVARYTPTDVVDTLADRVMVPSTPLHDEQMFLRSIQTFECVYSTGAAILGRATDSLERGAAERATALLNALAARLSATAALYRVLTTMPPPVFAIIRRYTAGRSAVQSHTYRQVERIAAPRDSAAGGPRTLQDVFLRGSGAGADAVRAAMLAVDTAWCAMKRTHWGITVKTIGNVRGTGGTAGASYLRAAAGQPLFPALAGARGAGR